MEVLWCILIWQKDKQADMEEKKHMGQTGFMTVTNSVPGEQGRHLILRELAQSL